jgi:xanthine dehydrogenase accessory factor
MTDISSPWPLFGLADDSRPPLRRILENGECAALATISALGGGGPRPAGTQMVIGRSEVSGFLSGGCLEADVVAHARLVLQSGRARRLVYGEGSPWPDIRLMCGARIEILLERISPADTATHALFELTDQRRPALWISDGARRACGCLDRALPFWPGALEKVFEPFPRLIVIGGDPTALAIAALGGQAGYQTTLVRPKGPPGAAPFEAVAYSRDEPGAALAAIGLDAWTAVAVATHDAELDHAALMVALPSEAFYVGALGARRRLPERLAQLRAEGMGEAFISRLHAPIGLDIGGKAPWEVAIATLGEIIAQRAARVRHMARTVGMATSNSERSSIQPRPGKKPRAASGAKTSRTLRTGPSSTRK